jgi:putative oxidoreductase
MFEELSLYHKPVGVLIVRVFLGMLFFFQGYDAVFRVKPRNVIRAFETQLGNRNMPGFLVAGGAYYTSFVGLLAGLLLILGLFKYIALYLLGIDLLLAAFAFGLIKPMWDMQHVFPRVLLLFLLLVLPESWDVFTLDHLLFFHKP